LKEEIKVRDCGVVFFFSFSFTPSLSLLLLEGLLGFRINGTEQAEVVGGENIENPVFFMEGQVPDLLRPNLG